jgi:hypothetical protein
MTSLRALRGILLLGLATAPVSCSSSDGDGTVESPAPASTRGDDPLSPIDRSGQTGSPGEDECQIDDDCAASAQQNIDQQTVAPPSTATFRNAVCASGVCRTTYVTESGCSPNIYGPYFDCTLDDAAIRDEYLEEVTLAPGECDTDPETGTGVCAGEAGEPDYYPRPAEEWQGMLVDLSVMPPCESSAGCGLARACVEGTCGPCVADSECAAGEGCVLDHCVRTELIECRRAAECAADALCILSGYTGGTARGNEDMRAHCLSSSGGAAMR